MTRTSNASHAPDIEPSVPGGFAFTADDFADIANILRAEAGIDLGSSKSTLVYSRLAKRLRMSGLTSFAAYRERIRDDAAERQAMIDALTTNTTSFFREPHHFEHLRCDVLPALMSAARGGRRVRLWSAAASSGQEPYSIAMTVHAADPEAARRDVRILATDINAEMIRCGLSGFYDGDGVQGVPGAMLKRYFTRTSDGARQGYTATAEIKQLIAFRRLNLLESWPMRGLFDVIFCRNIVIYFNAETQAQLWTRLASKLAMGGHLYIGHSERLIGPSAKSFKPVGVTAYQKVAEDKP